MTPTASATAATCGEVGSLEFWLGQREEQTLAVDLDVDEPLSALLHQVARGPGFEAMA